MTRKLLFILRHEEPRDDLKYIARIAQNNAHIKESDNVKIKILLLSSSYVLALSDFEHKLTQQVKLKPDLQKIIDSGGEVVFSIHSDYPKWGGSYDPDLISSYEGKYAIAKWFKEESVIKLVDPYEYVANAVKLGFEVIKW